MGKRKPQYPVGPRLIAYGRVSSDDQNLALQLAAFERAGVHPDNVHVEKKSGANDRRKNLELAIKDLREGDTFVVWKLDRMGRNPPKLYETLARVLAKGCGFRSLTENIDVGTAVGRLLFGILSAIAGFERDLISERTTAGLAVMRERAGKDWKWGRKAILTEAQVVRAGKMLNRERKPMSGPEVAKHFGVSTPTIYQHYRLNKSGHGARFIRKTKPK